MRILIFGAGNLIFADEGFGVHLIRYLQEHYTFPANVELYDGGTLGIMAAHKFDDADCVLMVDVVAVAGAPGTILRYDKEDILLKRLPTKLSPHQIGVQEMLTLAELRDCCPARVTLLGIIPECYDTSTELSAALRARLPVMAELIVAELSEIGESVGVM
ncbi:MAG: HyaD/HybD family hydrogenase maturation endopeptidase [Desulfuromonadales bacterium]|nr:HyaD/HybD family hydrogenase maturation endopeptidase [Desulfuromonadales bacterium]